MDANGRNKLKFLTGVKTEKEKDQDGEVVNKNPQKNKFLDKNPQKKLVDKDRQKDKNLLKKLVQKNQINIGRKINIVLNGKDSNV